MENNMADKLKSMLENPETMNMISAVLGSMQGTNSAPAPSSAPAEDMTVIDDAAPISTPAPRPDFNDSMFKIKQMLDSASTANDPRINLLTSLKPYMGAGRVAKMDQAIRLIQLSKMASIFKL